MATNYREYLHDFSKPYAELKKALPQVLVGFGKMHAAAHQEGILSEKTKELIAIAIAVAERCEPCLAMHIEYLIELKCARAEFLEMLGIAIYMGGGPSLMYAAKALQAFDDLSKPTATSK